MQIALSANRPNIEGEIDPRFGRCRYFLLVDPESMQYEAEENPHLEAPSGAGISAAQFIASKGVKAVITGNIGPNAHQVLTAAGIEMFTGVSGKIRNVVEIYKSGDLKSSSRPTGEMGMGRGMGQGRGMGRGGGMGGGMGCGRGMRGNRAVWADQSGQRQRSFEDASPPDEISYLKYQANTLAEELARIKERIQQIENK